MNNEVWSKKNPFSDKFVRQELKFFGKPCHPLIQETPAKILMRLDDYLNVNMRLDTPPYPILKLDGTVWMSLTPMELQSHYMPILWAKGVCATAGLGLGYFALRAAQKDEVKMVHVFEQDPQVIECFRAMGRMDKIEIHEGDARVEIPKYHFDTLFVDIYPELGDEAVIDDINVFAPCADYFSWWGYELFALTCLMKNFPDIHDVIRVQPLLKKWAKSPLHKLRTKYFGENYCRQVLDELHPHR